MRPGEAGGDHGDAADGLADRGDPDAHGAIDEDAERDGAEGRHDDERRREQAELGVGQPELLLDRREQGREGEAVHLVVGLDEEEDDDGVGDALATRPAAGPARGGRSRPGSPDTALVSLATRAPSVRFARRGDSGIRRGPRSGRSSADWREPGEMLTRPLDTVRPAPRGEGQSSVSSARATSTSSTMTRSYPRCARVDSASAWRRERVARNAVR